MYVVLRDWSPLPHSSTSRIESSFTTLLMGVDDSGTEFGLRDLPPPLLPSLSALASRNNHDSSSSSNSSSNGEWEYPHYQGHHSTSFGFQDPSLSAHSNFQDATIFDQQHTLENLRRNNSSSSSSNDSLFTEPDGGGKRYYYYYYYLLHAVKYFAHFNSFLIGPKIKKILGEKLVKHNQAQNPVQITTTRMLSIVMLTALPLKIRSN